MARDREQPHFQGSLLPGRRENLGTTGSLLLRRSFGSSRNAWRTLRTSAWEARGSSTFCNKTCTCCAAQGKLVLQQVTSHPRVPRVAKLPLNLIRSLFKQLATTWYVACKSGVACKNIRFSSLFAAGDVSRVSRFVPPGEEERGETDVFAG